MNIGPIKKAIATFLVTGSGAFAVAAADNAVTFAEGALVAATALAAAGAVYGVRNA